MHFGVALGAMHPGMFVEATEAADALGFESVWLPEHLVLPVTMAGSPYAGAAHPPVPPTTPIFDSLAYLCFLAGRTTRVRLGTHVYNLALRSPFVAARAVQTLDVVSGGRAELGVGAGWLASEWRAAELDFATRGRRLDEALEVCRRLWTEPVVSHRGEFFEFDEVMFEPKPVQHPHPPVLVGGETQAALGRAARHDGWIGLSHDARSAAPLVEALRVRRAALGFGEAPFTCTVGAAIAEDADIDALTGAGVDRVIVTPWTRTREVPEALGRFARRFIG